MMPRRCSREDRFGARVPAFVALVLLVLALGVARDGKRVMERFLADYPQIDAVLSANDSMALAFWKH